MFNLHTALEFPFMTRNGMSPHKELVVVFARLLHEESRRLEICIHVAERCFREFFNIPVNLSKLPCLLLTGNLKSNTPKEENSLWKPWFSSKAMSNFGRVVSQRRSFWDPVACGWFRNDGILLYLLSVYLLSINTYLDTYTLRFFSVACICPHWTWL